MSEPAAQSDAEQVETLELMLRLIHELSGPLSAMSIELATMEELLELPNASRKGAPSGELESALSGLRANLDRSIDQFHAVRTMLRARRDSLER